jgi:beta-fructofuranosidase
MHIPQGFHKEGMGDIEVIACGDVLHAFYLSLMSHDRVGHLTSRDGLNWKEEVPALHTGAPGDFDDDQIWTMGVFEHGGTYFMLYTGLAMKERGKVQRVGLATSRDLYTWTKHDKNPVAQADPRWYFASPDGKNRVDWRDPWVFQEDGVLHGLVTARTSSGPLGLRGCAGYMTSRDGYTWEVKEPLSVPGTLYDFETLAIAKLAGRYYLTGIGGRESGASSTSIYRVADQVTGPYRRVGHGELLPGGNLVFKPVVFKGETLYFSNIRGMADWEGGGGKGVTGLAPAKVAHAEPGGALVLKSFGGWKSVARGPQEALSGAQAAAGGEAVQGEWRVEGQGLIGKAPVGRGVFWLKEEREGMVMKARVRVGGAPEFGFVFRARGVDDATYVSLTPSLRRVQLYVIDAFHKTPCAGVTYRWRGRRVVQEWADDHAWGECVEIQLVAYGPYVEVSVDGRVLISAVTMRRPGGRVGFFVEDGEIEVGGVEILPLEMPGCMEWCI